MLSKLPMRRVNLIGGKGGVGKTTFAREVALALAKSGKKTLLGELEDESGWKSALARPFGRDHFSAKAELIEKNLYGIQIQAAVGQHQFLSSVVKIPGLSTAILAAPGIKWFLDGAPAFREMGWFYNILTEIQKDYDAVVLDMPATGHFVGLARLPKLLLGMIPFGPIAEKLKEGQRIIYDPVKSGAWIVTLPQELPITEGMELADALKDAQVPIAGTIVNRFTSYNGPAISDSKLLNEAQLQTTSVQRLLKENKNNGRIFSLPEILGSPQNWMDQIQEHQWVPN